VLGPAGVRLTLTAAPGTEGRWGLGYVLGILPGGDRLAYHEGANRGWRAGLALPPDRRAGIAVLANGDDGNAPIDAVVQQWLGLAAPNPKRARDRAAVLAILAVAAAAALGLAVRRRTPRSLEAVRKDGRSLARLASGVAEDPLGRGEARPGWSPGGRPVEVIIHLAGTLQPRKPTTYTAANLGTVQATLAALAGSWVQRVVFLSFPTADPRSPNPYLRAKAQAEAALRDSGIPTTILRCHHIYGPPKEPGPMARSLLAGNGRSVTVLGRGR
jgi:Beta-lactamase